MPLPNPKNPEPRESQSIHDELKPPAKVGITRRFFNTLLAGTTFVSLANGISGGKLSAMIIEDDSEYNAHTEEIEHALEKKAQEIEAEKELTDIEKAKKWVDYLGMGVFAWGISDLMPKEWVPTARGHIHQWHYVSMISLLKMKHEMGTDEERHHLEDEMISNTKAFGIISGSIAFAEGLDADIAEILETDLKREPKDNEKIALMTTLSSVLSPMATTVGSATIIRQMSNELAETGQYDKKGKSIIDHDFAAVATSHISNLSGYLMFGDPPFIAICEKYGFVEGIKWQMETVWPLALYSLFSSNVKMNYLMRKRQGKTGGEAMKMAVADSVSGIKTALPVLAKIIARSIKNTAKYALGNDASTGFQDIKGLQLDVGNVLSKKLANLAKLPFSPEFDGISHETFEGMVRGGHQENEAVLDFIRKLGDETATNPNLHEGGDRFSSAIKDGDYNEAVRIGKERGVPDIETQISIFRDLADNHKVDDSHTKKRKIGIGDIVNPFAIYHKATDIDRIKNALGHNLGDVVNAFPFQAGCVPFLMTGFKDAIALLDSKNLPKWQREMAMFFMITGFSMLADNYVACKIGLELFPDKPEIPLIASIQGGSMSAIGNMANIAQFSLDDFPLGKSLAKMHWHADTLAMNATWALAMDNLKKVLPFLPDVPKPIKGAGMEAPQANTTQVEAPKKEAATMSRRKMFGLFSG